MPNQFGRPVPGSAALASFIDEADRMSAFVPPFRFTAFFSPEDTLLCAIASEAALARVRPAQSRNGRSRSEVRIVELTTGSGLVGLHLLRLDNAAKLTGLDIDPTAVETAASNARRLSLGRRSRFVSADIWTEASAAMLAAYEPHLLICNPPYVPEPPGDQLGIEAGAGPDGTAHLTRTIELAAAARPAAMALSWCSLSDPARIVHEAESIGYTLNSLYIVVISDGEYSGRVHAYLKSLPHAYISEERDTVDAVAPDGSGRFAYLLMAGDFSLGEAPVTRVPAVERIVRDFSRHGMRVLTNHDGAIPVQSWMLDRWDEVRLRASLHGTPESAGTSSSEISRHR